MANFIHDIFSSDGFMPHGHCYLWLPELVWLHVVSDGLTALAYTSIPFTLVYFIRRRRDLPFNWIFLCFGAFIIACGATHAMEIWTLWTPLYWLSGVIKAVTAVASIATAVLLIRMVPRALAMPTQAQMLAAHQALEGERRRADEHQKRLAAIVDSSSDAIVGQDLDGVITSWNEGARALFGYLPEEIIGKPSSILVPEDGREHAADVLRRVLDGEKVAPFDALARRKDGTTLHVSSTKSIVRDADGVVIGASTTTRDISERLRAAEALSRSKDASDALNRELEAFSYSVAHDLRAPLRAINGFSTALLEDEKGSITAESEAHLRRIVAAADRMNEVIDALLALARLTRTEAAFSEVDLSGLARSVVEHLRAAHPEREVTVKIEDGMVALGDHRLLRVMLENLLGNAWKFTGKRAAATIVVGRETSSEGTVFFVKDDGAGFDMALAEKLFTPFRRLHRSTEFEGTGIGLATVQRVVSRHRGRIWAESDVGKGATFRFTLARGHEREGKEAG